MRIDSNEETAKHIKFAMTDTERDTDARHADLYPDSPASSGANSQPMVISVS